MSTTRKINIYLVARISKDAHPWNEQIAGVFTDPIDIFLPHQHNPWNIQHQTIPYKVYQTDIKAIKNSHIGLALPEFGSDCSFEVGYYAQSNKPVIVYVDTQKEWLKDWMVKGGVDYVVTTNKDTYEVLRNDPILKHKEITHIDQVEKLNAIVKSVYKTYYSKTQ